MLQSDHADAHLCLWVLHLYLHGAWGLTVHGRAASQLSRSVVATGWPSAAKVRSQEQNKSKIWPEAAIAQLGERQTEDLKAPGSIPGLGKDSWTHVAK